MNTSYSNNSTCKKVVRAADGTLFPVSALADAAIDADLTDNGVMSEIVFTMRSEPGRVMCAGR